MIAKIQIVLTVLLTFIYAVFQVDYSSWLSIISILAIYLALNIGFIILMVISFVVIAYTTEHVHPKTLWKHQLLTAFSTYYFSSLLRVKPIVKGAENIPKHSNFVVYANHIEYNDPFYIKMLYNHTTLSFIAKEPLFEYPILRNLLRSVGAIPISDKADRKSLESILKTIKVVKSGQPIGIFPEGKRSYSNNPQAFKPGAFKVVQKAKADISLVALYDFHKMQEKKFRIRKVKIYLSVLPIIRYEDIKDLDTVAISRLAFESINHEIEQYKKEFKD
jgi:1-acyl-sn-glycerol-3-phosphate acyltransferase